MLVMNINLSHVHLRHVPPTSRVSFSTLPLCEELEYRAVTDQIFMESACVSHIHIPYLQV